jgi:uncharacterized protein DUF3999
MKHRSLALVAVLAAGPLLAGENPGDFAARLPIEVPPGAALVRLTLPESAYAALAGPELADLRIFNGAGEALPVARLPAPRETSLISARVPLLPLPETAIPGVEARLRISRAADGTLLRVEVDQPRAQAGAAPQPPARPARYLADLKPFDRALTALVLEPADASPFEGSLSLETSDDLAHWQTLRTAERVLALSHGEQRVERLRIELPSVRARYLRLAWTSRPAPVALAGLTLEHTANPEAPRQWVKLAAQPGDAPGGWRYVAPGLFPVDRLRVEAAEPNSVARVEVGSRPASRDPWHFQGGFTTYRLNQDGGEITSPAFTLPPRRDPLWQLKLQPAGGAAPTLALGWQPEALVFAARGAPPFTLAVGQPRLPAAFLPVESLVPAYATDRAPPLAEGRVLPPAPGSTAPPRRDAPAWQDGRSLGLWAVLVLGVAVLGWMAVRLLREGRGQ